MMHMYDSYPERNVAQFHKIAVITDISATVKQIQSVLKDVTDATNCVVLLSHQRMEIHDRSLIIAYQPQKQQLPWKPHQVCTLKIVNHDDVDANAMMNSWTTSIRSTAAVPYDQPYPVTTLPRNIGIICLEIQLNIQNGASRQGRNIYCRSISDQGLQ